MTKCMRVFIRTTTDLTVGDILWEYQVDYALEHQCETLFILLLNYKKKSCFSYDVLHISPTSLREIRPGGFGFLVIIRI